MTRVALLGSQSIGVAFLDILASLDDVEVALVVSSEREGDELLGHESLLARARFLNLRAVVSECGEEVLELLSHVQPDILFSVYYRALLSRDALEIPPLGCVNIHPSLLPRYRGPTPTAWAILNAETTFGITIHYMDAGIDTGDVLAQEIHDIDRDETGYELHMRAMRLGADLLRRTFRGIVNRTLTRNQQAGPVSYYGKLKADCTIDWQSPAETIRNAIRVYASPYARARTSLQDVFVLVNRATVLGEGHRYCLQGPGKIVDVVADDALVVAAADGFLILDEYETIPRLPDAARAAILRKGARLGYGGVRTLRSGRPGHTHGTLSHSVQQAEPRRQ
jgi:methionyl-tRNA formyltransferase